MGSGRTRTCISDHYQNYCVIRVTCCQICYSDSISVKLDEVMINCLQTSVKCWKNYVALSKTYIVFCQGRFFFFMTTLDHTLLLHHSASPWATLLWCFDRPPYSPDRAPSDFHLFLELITLFGGQRVANNDELETEVNTRFGSMAVDWYTAGLKRLLPRYEECLKKDGNHLEK